MLENYNLTIKSGSFVCTLNCVESLLDLQMTKVRKLLEIMFLAEGENRDTIKTISDWLDTCPNKYEVCISQAEALLQSANTCACAKHSEQERMGDSDYWAKSAAACKAELKKATAYVKWLNKSTKARNAKKLASLKQEAADHVDNLTRTLKSAIARRDAVKQADRAVIAAQRHLSTFKKDYAKAQKLQPIFNKFKEEI